MNSTVSDSAYGAAPVTGVDPTVTSMAEVSLKAGEFYINQVPGKGGLGVENLTLLKIGIQICCAKEPGSDHKDWIVKIVTAK